jgi:hypothetical protein
MTHGEAREEKWRGNKRMEWVTSKHHMTAEHGLHEQYKPCRLMCTARLPIVDWTDAPADLNGLVRSAERRNLVYARVPSHFKRSLTLKKAWIFRNTLHVPRNTYFDIVPRRLPPCSSVLVNKLTVAQQSKCSLRITQHEVVGTWGKRGAGGAAAPATRSASSGKMDGKWIF